MSKITNDEIIEEVKGEEMVSVSQTKLNYMLEQIEELKRNQSDAVKNKFEKAKEHYDWPLQAKYRMWAWVPVLGAKSVKKDEAFELYYKNPMTGQRVDNHYLELRLLNGTLDGNKKVLNSSFANFYERSELTDFGVILKDWTEIATVNHKKLSALQDEVANYVFNTKEHWKLIVDKDQIN